METYTPINSINKKPARSYEKRELSRLTEQNKNLKIQVVELRIKLQKIENILTKIK